MGGTTKVQFYQLTIRGRHFTQTHPDHHCNFSNRCFLRWNTAMLTKRLKVYTFYLQKKIMLFN